MHPTDTALAYHKGAGLQGGAQTLMHARLRLHKRQITFSMLQHSLRTQYSTFIHRHSGMSMLNGDRHEEECFSGPCMMASCHGALC